MGQPVHWETSCISQADPILHFPSFLHLLPCSPAQLCINEASPSWTTRFALESLFRCRDRARLCEAQSESTAVLHSSGCRLLPPAAKRVFWWQRDGQDEEQTRASALRHWARHKR